MNLSLCPWACSATEVKPLKVSIMACVPFAVGARISSCQPRGQDAGPQRYLDNPRDIHDGNPVHLSVAFDDHRLRPIPDETAERYLDAEHLRRRRRPAARWPSRSSVLFAYAYTPIRSQRRGRAL